jgi:hypothetical protein
MRHIVVEGPDGSGKTNLVNDLVKHTGRPVHPRSTPSVGGPPPDLDLWVEREFARDKQPGIYDRHSVISEPIYGPICRGFVPGAFSSPLWLNKQRARLANMSVVVFCLPPWSDVFANIMSGTHMAGVRENGYEIYMAYNAVYKAWPGAAVLHDYTRGDRHRAQTIARIAHVAKER